MLAHLSIRNFAVIDSVDVNFSAGMVALSGETGAGKSIVVDALSLVTGARSKPEVIRPEAEEAEVGAVFHLEGDRRSHLNAALDAEGLPLLEGGALIVRRVLARNGRHRQTINGAMVTVKQLKDLVANLVDFTSQNTQHHLESPVRQTELLDSFGGHRDLLDEVGAHFARIVKLDEEIRQLSVSDRDRLSRIDWLKYQLEEIDALNPVDGELEELEEKRLRLKHRESLRTGYRDILTLLDDGDSDSDAMSLLRKLAHRLHKLTQYAPAMTSQIAAIEEVSALLDEVSRSIRHEAAAIDDDETSVDDVESRHEALTRLTRKHGCTLDELLLRVSSLRHEMVSLENADVRLSELQAIRHRSFADASDVAARLRAKRIKAKDQLAERIESHLADLAMPHARFTIDLVPLSRDEGIRGHSSKKADADDTGDIVIGRFGGERASFVLAANPGVPGGPLARVASGGELSRVLLAIKSCRDEEDVGITAIFDEVDAGVGGSVGATIGDKLKAHAARSQVICVTHLASVAAVADQHLVVEKRIEAGKTRSFIMEVTEEKRVAEVARMLGGKSITERTRAHAEEILLAKSSSSDSGANVRVKGTAPKSVSATRSSSPTKSSTTKLSTAKAVTTKATTTNAAKAKAATAKAAISKMKTTKPSAPKSAKKGVSSTSSNGNLGGRP